MRNPSFILYSICLVLCQFSYLCLPTLAVTEMDKGIALYNKGDYHNALNHFVLTLRNNPNDANALYYQGLTFHHMKEFSLAKQSYSLCIKRCPNTPAAKSAQAALTYLDPAYYKNMQQQAAAARSTIAAQPAQSSTESAEFTNLPDTVRIPYQRDGQNLVVSTYINGRPIDMFFDSGAESTVVFKSQLEQLGIRAPEGKHVGTSHGVGDGGAQKIWVLNVALKVGPIERKNFPLHVQEDATTSTPKHPLLGESFFRDFTLSMDNSPDNTSGTITFRKKNAAKSFSASESSVIPFTNWGKEIIVNVEVNNKMVPMIYDTGASHCAFSYAQFKTLGFSIPEDAEEGMDAGVAGTTRSWKFNIPHMRLGSVIKNDVPISVTESSGIPYPLLGNSFLGDLRVDIDNTNHIMRVRR